MHEDKYVDRKTDLDSGHSSHSKVTDAAAMLHAVRTAPLSPVLDVTIVLCNTISLFILITLLLNYIVGKVPCTVILHSVTITNTYCIIVTIHCHSSLCSSPCYRILLYHLLCCQPPLHRCTYPVLSLQSLSPMLSSMPTMLL